MDQLSSGKAFFISTKKNILCSDEFVGVSNELHDIITNPSLMEATSLFPISQTPQSEHDMFEKN